MIGYQAVAAFTMTGQLGSALVLDALGAFGLEPRQPSPLRVGGVLLALSGALASQTPPSATRAGSNSEGPPAALATASSCRGCGNGKSTTTGNAKGEGVGEGEGVSLVSADSAALPRTSTTG